MAVFIPVVSVSHGEGIYSLSGISYRFEFKYTERTQRWSFDVYLDEELLVGGVTVMEGLGLLGRYALESFDHGDIYCVRFEEDSLPAGRDNLGLDLPYTLVYVTNDEASSFLT